MKKIILISAAILGIFSIASCVKEAVDPSGEGTMRTVISAKVASTKTALGDKVGSEWPNYWKTDDLLSINGVTSDPLDSGFDGNATAQFTFAGSLTTPYCAAYPASAVGSYSAGSATVTVPATQNYVADSYDPEAFLMIGKSNTPGTVGLSAKVSVIHLSLTGTVSVNSVKLTGGVGAALSGSFTTDYATLTPSSVSNIVELVAASPVALPADFFICVPAGLSGALQVEVFDNEGGSMTKNATLASALDAGKVFSPAEFAYAADSYAPVITAEGITSSTAIICWDSSPAPAYTIGVYSDAGCSSLVNSYAVPADNGCWGGASPRFCISGLAAGTTYYVKVTNVAQSVDSNILPVTTAAFDIVVPDDTPAAVDDVILAEDFGELRWDSDLIGNGVGFFPTALDAFSNVEVDQFRAVGTSSEKVLSAQTSALGTSRLQHWAQGANANLYIHPGYIKLVGSNKVTHLVTPALDNIPAGKVATLDVEVTASAYYSASSSSFATTSAVVAVQTGDLNELTDDTKTNTLDLATNVQPITLDEASAWKTYKVTLTGVTKGNRLAFGAASGVSGNDARMNVSDMKVTIKALDEPALVASVKAVSSSSLAFTWTHQTYSAAEDVAKPYTFALYRDSACTDLVVSYESTENADRWDNKSPCFVFGGLNPNTEYWFVATDTDASISSDPVSATTAAFTVVESADVNDPQAGDIILAEDFSEISHGPDELAVAAGFVPTDHTLVTVPSGANPEGAFVIYSNTGNRVFGSGWDITGSRMANGWGFFGNSACFTRSGYLRVAASDGRTHIVTPALSCIPAGKIATIEVTVTACKYESNTNDVAVFAEKGLTMNPEASPSSSNFRKYTGASLSVGHALGITSVKEWETKSVTINNVDNECQLIIGSLENIDGKNRFYFNDIIVEVVSIEDIPLKSISNDETFLEFVTEVAGGNKSLDAIVTADLNLAPATISAFESIEDYTGTFDGDNHTITGLTKPLFATLEGTVQNLTLNSTISSDDADDPIWGILAKQLSAGSVSSCTAQGSITYSATSPSAQAYIGGVVGKYSGGTLTGCYNEASITYSATGSNKIYIGGVVSNNEKSTLSDCHSTAGTISVTGYSTVGAVYVGGVVGYDSKTIDSCTNAMTVDLGGTFSATSDNYFCPGGIAGKVTGGSITNCLNTGDVICSHKNSGSKGYTFVGGLVGELQGSISNSSNGGTVSFTGKTDSQNPFIGGVVGSTHNATCSITGKYSTASATNYGEVIVNTSSQSKKYVYVGGIAGRLHTTGTMTATNNGPITITKLTCTQAYVGGLAGLTNAASSTINSGSANMAGGVITITSLTGKGASSWSAYIGGVVGQAKGAVNANNSGNLAINGLKATLNACIGGIAGWNAAAVSGNNDGNVVISSGTTFTKSAHIGGIIGHGESPVSSSTNSGIISNDAPMNDTGGYLQVGGIVGYNNTPCTITDCHNTGDVTNTADAAGYLYVGGITSESDAEISGCTNTGDVSNSGDSGNEHPICVGGITGVASANVTSSSNGTDTLPGGTISNTGNSAEDICIGGVIGWNNNKEVTNCFNKGDVTNSGDGGNIAAGGVVGWSSATSSYVAPNTNSGTITNTGTASTAAYTGEVIGHQAE
ncbi:MAG: hypothetical protein IKX45_08155 [Bacteroidales bacterium]|nr:hypothetical protein [Bacteroidales bacterium]